MGKQSLAPQIEQLNKKNVWNNLKVVKNNQVYIINSSIGVFSPLNIEYGIEAISKAMNK
ncbi:hypothetical protein D3C85_1929590 [compost metagenome]